MELSGARFSLRQAGQTVDIEGSFVSHLQEAMGTVAGFAIEAGLDDIASDATEVMVELEQHESDDDYPARGTTPPFFSAALSLAS